MLAAAGVEEDDAGVGAEFDLSGFGDFVEGAVDASTAIIMMMTSTSPDSWCEKSRPRKEPRGLLGAALGVVGC
ncbi:MAG: hypothetical protein R3B67_05170 [Phycisphaerales bacterium]